ncbi:hypothetical protein GCM10008018_58540 [Paenibacillus marchantiophytorum]|uniref:Copper amine oxidase-like N-terminal domain-containing protein n=1 Tax=Paenibacillus marchantiophytorum TaxID=1619310 RepID=A0ABQ1FAL5_9BACL|nr:stalk domain-containing protein [Paenibacillus marchantiophytorum]GGA04939.1 hypothetical protein GCM10008018_58540 [Paenibacillus marchantiophytorum]
MRKLIVLILIVLSMASTHKVYAENEIGVYYLGTKIDFDVKPVMIDGTLMVQFRPVFEKMGLTVTWDEQTRKISGKKNDLVIDLFLGNKYAIVNQTTKELQVVPQIRNGSTMVPLRFISESSGKIVKWYESSNYVDITNGVEKKGSYKPYAGESFIDLDYTPKFPSYTQPYISEKNGYTYAMWVKEEQFPWTQTALTNIYVSVAKDGKWIIKNQLMSSQRRDSQIVRYSYFFEDGSFYWRDDVGLKKITSNEYGFSNESYIFKMSYPTNKVESINPVYIDGEMNLLYGSGGDYRIYKTSNGYWESNNYIEVKDIFKILPQSGINTSYIYSSAKKILYILTDNGYKQLKIDTGDLLYDSKGNDLVEKISPTAMGNPLKWFHEGNLYYLYMDGQGSSYKFGFLNQDMTYVSGIPTQIKVGSIENSRIILTDSEIRFWSSTLFERKPVMELHVFNR